MEIVHYFDSDKDLLLQSQARSFYKIDNGYKSEIKIPMPLMYRFFAKFRLLRRLFRLDKSNCHPLFNENGEVVGLTTGSLSSIASDLMGSVPHNINYAVKSSFVTNTISTVPDSLFSNRGIVVVPKESNSRSDFIEAIKKNVVLIVGKVD